MLSLKSNFASGVGRTGPDPNCDHLLPDGVIVPIGKGTDQHIGAASLLYNEYLFTCILPF